MASLENPAANLEAEESVLGAIMLSPRILDSVSEILRGEEFYKPSHEAIYQASLELYLSGDPLDAITLAAKLESEGRLDDVGGKKRIHELAGLVPAATNAPHYAKIVRDQFVARCAALTALKISQARGDSNQVLQQAEDALEELRERAQGSVRKRIYTAEETMAWHEGLQEETADSDEFTPPLPLLAPWRRGRLYILGGHTADGKSVLGLQLLREWCTQGKKVGFVSLEMSMEDLTNRLLCSAGFPLRQVERQWEFDNETKEKIQAWRDKFRQWDYKIIDDPSAKSADVKRYQKMGRFDAIVVDHIHQMDWGTDRRNLEREVVAFANLAREENIVVLLLSQLRRPMRDSNSGLPRPTLLDFKESGAIEQNAALALGIWRKWNEGIRQDDGELIVLKSRYGEQERGYPVWLNRNRVRFEIDQGRVTDTYERSYS